jgi:hypothetical protein
MLGANPPSSPLPVANPSSLRILASLWKISDDHLIASSKLGAPSGNNMYSWKSTVLSACSPPFNTFNIGAGNDTS